MLWARPRWMKASPIPWNWNEVQTWVSAPACVPLSSRALLFRIMGGRWRQKRLVADKMGDDRVGILDGREEGGKNENEKEKERDEEEEEEQGKRPNRE